ncbi:3-carboxy-cis,cis-muconate cycloisomerase [Ochrobactrum daejeonense]|uniref:3-carboxy-cis,cis-muconate cycloisomerase n=1 Tax=Brucella daejeonensis TaxID=659015 RepID=A0A7W9AZL4_9HYPH|nr:3-carboxy-cis,cis-muconate cycloisomerase [Brucella daejeonensis]MBB5703535.1 3-carboxy-cis,cis-muconate cycloisomerase [Brucella daejeonensis]NKB78966.1 3-carboxy-cis,cis-muconate cycloisomerase [Brucella daejeonensis]
MSISVFEHPFLAQLFGDDEEILSLFTAAADISEMLRFETALAEAQADLGLIPVEAGQAIRQAAETFEPNLSELAKATARDGVVVPSFVNELRKTVGNGHGEYVHFGATSQDVIDTSLILRLKRAAAILSGRLQQLAQRFDWLDAAFGKNRLTGYTRMQAAIPITVSDRIASWRQPLGDYEARLNAVVFPVQFGGAAGTLEKFADDGAALRKLLADRLELHDGPQWHSQRAFPVEFGNLLSLVTGTLGKFGQDIALMAELGAELSLTGGGGSSAMPHKQNPIAAETLVGLARFNAAQMGGLHQAMLHEQERSGAAWMVEWMILPQIVASTGSVLNIASALIDKIARIGNEQPPNI